MEETEVHMKTILIYLPILMTIAIIILAWSSGYGAIINDQMIMPLGVVFIGSLNLLLTIRSNYQRQQISQF